MSRRITQSDLDAEIRSNLAGVRIPEPASLGQVLVRLPEGAAAPRRWSLAISATLAAVLIVAVAIVGLPFIGSTLGPAAPAATSGPSVSAATQRSEAPSATGVSVVGPAGLIPWLDRPVAVPPEPTPITITPPPGLTACAAADLTAVMMGYGGAAGTTYTGVRVTNASRATCYLQGTPGAQLLDRKMNVVLDGTNAVGAMPGTPSVEGGDPIAVLPPGGSTDLSIGWSDWCGPAIAGPFSFAIVLPAKGGRFVATWAPGVQPMATPVACMGGGSSEVFSDGPFQPQAGSVTPTPEPTPLPPQVTFGNLPTGSIPLGTTIRYTVTLTNASGAPLDLRAFADGSSCPTYEELLTEGSPITPLAFTLNCSSLGLIAPGASVMFAMQMPTTGLRAGSYTLFWILAPDRLGPSGKVSVTIG